MKRVLVTGAAKGIGRAVAEALLREYTPASDALDMAELAARP